MLTALGGGGVPPHHKNTQKFEIPKMGHRKGKQQARTIRNKNKTNKKTDKQETALSHFHYRKNSTSHKKPYQRK